MAKFWYFFILVVIFLYSCKKTELTDIKPVIQFRIAENHIYSDTALNAGNQYVIGIIASSANGESLTNLYIESNGIRIFDKGYNQPEINEDIILIKNLEQIEILNFIIRNKARKADTITLKISKLEASYSNIVRFSNIILGAQNNQITGNYFSFSNGLVYKQPEAFNFQELIDIIYYYDAAGDANTLASPGANLSGIITGDDSPQNWTVKRTTHYSRTPLQIDNEEFNTAMNDSIIISHLFTDGGRKAKQLQNNQFYEFQNNENKFGIIKIEEVIGQDAGDIHFSLIVQE